MHTATSITPLSRPTSTILRSSLVIPTIPQVVSELIHNSLDARATTVNIWIDLTRGDESVRLQDDGDGIKDEDLDKVGRRFRTSKKLNEHALGPLSSYGFRGEALSSIAALAQVDITTRTASSTDTRTKIIKSKILFQGPVSSRAHHISGSHGTTIVVKDIFHNLPVRKKELDSTPTANTTAACRKVVERLALVHPAVKWGLWEGKDQKKILHVAGTRSSLDVFRLLFGNALVHRVQNIRVSSSNRKVEGFISLSGDVTKAHQHLYVNGYPIDRGVLHVAISKRFATSRFASMASSGAHEEMDDYNDSGRRSPRRLERHPIYVLNVTLPSEDVDVAYEPKKGLLGYKDFDSIKALLLAVIEEYFKRNGYSLRGSHSSEIIPTTPSPIKSSVHRPTLPTPRTPSRLAIVNTPVQEPASPSRIIPTQPNPFWVGPNVQLPTPRQDHYQAASIPDRPSSEDAEHVSRTIPISEDQNLIRDISIEEDNSLTTNISRKRRRIDHESQSPNVHRINDGSTRKHQWISDLIAEANATLFPFPPSDVDRPAFLDALRGGRDSYDKRCNSDHGCSKTSQNGQRATSTYLPRNVEVTLTRKSLQGARVVGQVDKKYIAILVLTPIPTSTSPLLTSKRSSSALVLVDQHAADERVSVESILSELCLGFLHDNIPTTQLENIPMILLTKAEAQILSEPGIEAIFRRWGIHLVLPENVSEDGDYVQVQVNAVPSILKSRLGKKEGVEMSRLISLHLTGAREMYGEVQAMLRSHDINDEVSDHKSYSREQDDRRIRNGSVINDANDSNCNVIAEQGTEDNNCSLSSDVQSVEGGEEDWGRAIRFMPKEMLELANSKACRGAIMFEDRLSLDQCSRLIDQLAQCRFSFMCAHGRPAMAPLLVLPGLEVSTKASRTSIGGKLGRRAIDWRAWKARNER